MPGSGWGPLEPCDRLDQPRPATGREAAPPAPAGPSASLSGAREQDGHRGHAKDSEQRAGLGKRELGNPQTPSPWCTPRLRNSGYTPLVFCFLTLSAKWMCPGVPLGNSHFLTPRRGWFVGWGPGSELISGGSDKKILCDIGLWSVPKCYPIHSRPKRRVSVAQRDHLGSRPRVSSTLLGKEAQTYRPGQRWGHCSEPASTSRRLCKTGARKLRTAPCSASPCGGSAASARPQRGLETTRCGRGWR